VVFLQKGEEPILIGTFSVVFRWPLDVADSVVNLRNTDAESTVSFLPGVEIGDQYLERSGP
jgi:hypothetical protein